MQRNPRDAAQLQVYQTRIQIRNDFIAALNSQATTVEDIAFRANFYNTYRRDPTPADVPRWRDIAIPVSQINNLEQRFISLAREHMILACTPLAEDQSTPSPQTNPTDHRRSSPNKPPNITRNSVRHSPDLSETRRAKARTSKAQQEHTHLLCCNTNCNSPTPHNAPRCTRRNQPMHIECAAPEITQTICLSCYAITLDFTEST